MDIGSILFYQPIFNLVVVLYRFFGGDLALAVVGLALISRIITFPFTMKQMQMAQSSQDMNARVKEIKEKYKNDQQKQAEELMRVQGEYLPGQLGGCLGLIVQLIMVVNILSVMRNLVDQGVSSFNAVAYPFVAQFAAGEELHKNFFGILNLTQSAGAIAGNDWLGNLVPVLPYVILALVVGITQYLSTKVMTATTKKPEAETPKKQKKKDAKGVTQPEDFGEILQRSTQQTMMIFPVLIFVSALSFPAVFGIYWTVQNGFVIIQQLVVDQWKKRNAAATAK
jgi:YidC/Oxa1 family membrane protein insertase